jgi:hypothetical protein
MRQRRQRLGNQHRCRPGKPTGVRPRRLSRGGFDISGAIALTRRITAHGAIRFQYAFAGDLCVEVGIPKATIILPCLRVTRSTSLIGAASSTARHPRGSRAQLRA